VVFFTAGFFADAFFAVVFFTVVLLAAGFFLAAVFVVADFAAPAGGAASSAMTCLAFRGAALLRIAAVRPVPVPRFLRVSLMIESLD
tara:strand:- start:882 stop:1142 length:261 start_codon:yes stop_codon:yes gene_type:complete